MGKYSRAVYNTVMSTTHIPFAFYGCYFASLAEAERFLADSGTDYDSDCVYNQKSNVLGLQYLEDGSYILGFSLRAGESEAGAKECWNARLASGGDAQSHFELFTY